MLADPNQPCLLNVIVEAEENAYPMIPAGGTYKGIIMADSDLLGLDQGKQGTNI